MKEKIFLAKITVLETAEKAKRRFMSRVVNNTNGDGVETLVHILGAVVIGALVIGLVYALIQEIFPEVAQKIRDLLNFGGTSGSGGGGGGETVVT